MSQHRPASAPEASEERGFTGYDRGERGTGTRNRVLVLPSVICSHVVADRIASRVRGQVPTATYDGKTICFVEAGMDAATFVEFGYGDEPVVREASRALHWGKLAYNEAYWLTARGVL